MDSIAIDSAQQTPPDGGDLFARHQAAVLRYARRRVGDDDADDIVSQVFEVAAGKLAAGVEPDEPLAWLYGLAFNVVRAHRARTGRLTRLRARLAGVRDPGRAAMADPAVDIASALWVSQQIDALPEKDAELLRLIVFEDLSVTAAAKLIGVSVGAANTRLYRIRGRFERLLAPRTDTEGTRHEP